MRWKKWTNVAAAAALALLAHADANAEHDPDDSTDSGGVVLQWLLELGKAPVSLEKPVLDLRLTNREAIPYVVSVGTLEDHGSLQTRRLGEPTFVTVPAGKSVDVPVRFGGKTPRELSHSGLVVALATACPADDGRCTNAASEPVFFHPGKSGFTVYGERVLCEQLRCGDLQGKGVPEPGTWRVLGGGPLHDVTVHEEAVTDEDDDRVVEGDDR